MLKPAYSSLGIQGFNTTGIQLPINFILQYLQALKNIKRLSHHRKTRVTNLTSPHFGRIASTGEHFKTSEDQKE